MSQLVQMPSYSNQLIVKTVFESNYSQNRNEYQVYYRVLLNNEDVTEQVVAGSIHHSIYDDDPQIYKSLDGWAYGGPINVDSQTQEVYNICYFTKNIIPDTTYYVEVCCIYVAPWPPSLDFRFGQEFTTADNFYDTNLQIVYDSNGGIDGPVASWFGIGDYQFMYQQDSDTPTSTMMIQVCHKTPTKEGYRFAGWEVKTYDMWTDAISGETRTSEERIYYSRVYPDLSYQFVLKSDVWTIYTFIAVWELGGLNKPLLWDGQNLVPVNVDIWNGSSWIRVTDYLL